jgi:membrane fusion protein, multidrug efflux system
MKRIIILSATALFLAACGEQPQGLAAKKAELKELKGQLTELKTQISTLESEVAKLDTTTEGGVPVRVLDLVASPFSHYIEQPGNVTSKENVTVSSEMGGVVKAILVQEGQWVNKGTAIVQLDATVMANQVEELRQSAELARTTFERQDNLWKKGIGSEIQHLQAKNQYLSLQKKLAATEAQLDKMELSAPISGRVDEIFFNVGELAAPGMPALRVVNARQVQVEANVSERYANSLRKNDEVHIEFKALGIERTAPISFVGEVINPKSRTFMVKIDLDNQSAEIKPNAVASLRIQDFAVDSAMVLPSAVIKRDMRGDFVFLVKGNKAKKTYIEVGRSYKDQSRVLTGLSFGDKVITAGHNEVADGSTIDIKK